jgi:hypothetical protein
MPSRFLQLFLLALLPMAWAQESILLPDKEGDDEASEGVLGLLKLGIFMGSGDTFLTYNDGDATGVLTFEGEALNMTNLMLSSDLVMLARNLEQRFAQLACPAFLHAAAAIAAPGTGPVLNVPLLSLLPASRSSC